MKACDYRVITCDEHGRAAFENQIGDLLADGFQLVGGVAYAMNDFGVFVFAQALVRYASE